MYGTLLSPRIQVDLWGDVKTGPIAELPGMFVQHTSDFPRLCAAPIPCAPAVGRVIDLTNDELRAATRYEGDTYALHEVELCDGSRALVFV